MDLAGTGRFTRAGLSVLACYDQLRHKIQALLSENEELALAVGRLRDQGRLRPPLSGPIGPMPSSAPAVLPKDHAGHFAYPSTVSGQDPDRDPRGSSGVAVAPAQQPAVAERNAATQTNLAWEPSSMQETQESALSTPVPRANSTNISTGSRPPITRSRSLGALSLPLPAVPSTGLQRLSCPFDRLSVTPRPPPARTPADTSRDVSLAELPRLSGMALSGGSIPASLLSAQFQLLPLDLRPSDTQHRDPWQRAAHGAPTESQQPVWEQLVGEIAFQLDRRILAYVFPARSCFHGFTVSNIPRKIMSMALDTALGTFYQHHCMSAVLRYMGVMMRLRTLGYNPAVHPAFAEWLVNTYGIVSDAAGAEVLALLNPPFLRRVVADTVPPAAQPHTLVLLECLEELAREDGQPLFMW